MPHHKRPEDRARRDRQSETRVSVNSMYGYKNKLPMVMLTVGDAKPLQFSTDEARRIARLLMEGAEAAEQDGFLLEFMMGPPIELHETQAANLLVQFREHRAKWMDDDL